MTNANRTYILPILLACTVVLAGCETIPAAGRLISRAIDEIHDRHAPYTPVQRSAPSDVMTGTFGKTQTQDRTVGNRDTSKNVTSPAHSPSQPSNEQACENELSRIRKSYTSFDYAETARLAATFLKVRKGSASQRAEAYVFAAAAAYVQGNENWATDYLRYAYKEDPTLTLNSAYFPDGLLRLQQTIRQQAKETK